MKRPRRGPALGGACLGIGIDSSQTRVVPRLPTTQSVHAVKTLRSPTRLATARGTTKPDLQKRDVVHLETKNSAAHGDVERAPQDEWSDRGLQVLDLKAAGALSCSCVVEAIRAGSHSIKLASPSMHHAPSRGRCRASVGRRQTDMNPSIPRVDTLSDRCLTLLDSVLDHDS